MQKEIHKVAEFIKNKMQELRKSKDKWKMFLIPLLMLFIPCEIWLILAVGFVIYLLCLSKDK